MDATHFRNRAANARELASAGDDLRLAQMLLDVAADLDAEAEAIEAEQRNADRLRAEQSPEATLIATDGADARQPIQIIDISLSSAKFNADRRQEIGSAVILQFPGVGVQLAGTIVRAGDNEATMVLNRESQSSAELTQLVKTDDLVKVPPLQAVN